MRIFVVIMGLLLLLSLGSQTIRHAYWAFTASQGSVLEPFAEPTERQIAKSKSLDDLVELYSMAHRKAQDERTRLKARNQGKEQEKHEYEDRDQEPFRSEELLKSAIETWESQQREILEVQFYWWSGAIVALAGSTVLARSQWWLGVSLLILGFIEMSYATSPAVPFGGSQEEFALFITYKVCYSLAALAALLAAWWHVSRLLASRYLAQTAL